MRERERERERDSFPLVGVGLSYITIFPMVERFLVFEAEKTKRLHGLQGENDKHAGWYIQI